MSQSLIPVIVIQFLLAATFFIIPFVTSLCHAGMQLPAFTAKTSMIRKDESEIEAWTPWQPARQA
jgi:hypothetical protein